MVSAVTSRQQNAFKGAMQKASDAGRRSTDLQRAAADAAARAQAAQQRANDLLAWANRTGRASDRAQAVAEGLMGEGDPLGARIIHVADALDSIRISRIYRDALADDEAPAEFRAGAQFCPKCVRALETVLFAEADARPLLAV